MLPHYLLERLRLKYKEPTRVYHTGTHVAALLEWMGRIQDQLSEPDVFEAAIWFHDAEYDLMRGDNEEKSAELARDWLAGVYEPETIEKVAQFVLSTKTHAATNGFDHPDLLLFLDADLSILGSSLENYRTYVAQVRQEYANVPKAVFLEKRRLMVQFWLNEALAGRLFKTETFGERFGLRHRAIQNFGWELNL
jgi:predicted metal-dependent HD superfamily phosphohydrolase